MQDFLNAHENKNEVVIGLSFSQAIDPLSELAHAINSRSSVENLSRLAASSIEKIVAQDWILSVSGYERSKIGREDIVELEGLEMYLPTDIREYCVGKILNFEDGEFHLQEMKLRSDTN